MASFPKNVEKFDKAQEAMQEAFEKLSPHEVLVLADSINSKGDENVTIALLGDKNSRLKGLILPRLLQVRDVLPLAAKSTTSLAKPSSSEVKDVNGDGVEDIVFTFTAKDVAKDMLPGAIYDVWLYSEAKNKPIAGIFGTA